MLKTHHTGKLLAYLTLSFADLFLTYALLQKTDGAVYEGNPIANAWLTAYGWAGLATFKLVTMLLVAAVAAYVSFYRPQIGGRLLGFACCAVAFVVAYSCWLANAYGMHGGPSDVHANCREWSTVVLESTIPPKDPPKPVVIQIRRRSEESPRSKRWGDTALRQEHSQANAIIPVSLNQPSADVVPRSTK
jgi:hypothetical protein